jgi:hypothetical protein
MAAREEAARAAMNDRIEANIDRVLSELSEIKMDVRRLDQNGATLANRISDVELQIINTREEVQRSSAAPRPSQVESAKRAIRDTAKSPAGVAVALALFVTTMVTAGDKVPQVMRFTERFWHFLSGRDVVAERQAPARTAQVPEK